MKRRSKILLALILLAPSVQALELAYSEDVMVLPNTRRILYVGLNAPESIDVHVNCTSELDVEHLDTIRLEGGEGRLALTVTTGEPGVYPLRFTANSQQGEIRVRVSRAPQTLARIIDRYETSLAQLKEGSGAGVPELSEAERVLEEARGLASEGMYYEANEKLSELQAKMEQASQSLAEDEVRQRIVSTEESPTPITAMAVYARTGVTYILLGLLIVVVILIASRAFSREEADFQGDISSIRRNINLTREAPAEETRHAGEKTEMDLKQLAEKIDTLKKGGKDTGRMESWLALSEKNRQKGFNNLAERYLEKLTEELGENG